MLLVQAAQDKDNMGLVTSSHHSAPSGRHIHGSKAPDTTTRIHANKIQHWP